MSTYELSEAVSGRVLATGELAPIVDAAVLAGLRTGKAYRVHAVWHADGRHGFTGPMRALRFGVDESGELWDVDGSGVPATVARTAELWVDGLHAARARDCGDNRNHSRKVPTC